jgi:MFS family permease
MTAFITPLLPFIRDSFSLDYTKAGILMSAFNIVYGFSQLPTGLLADRFGYRTMIAVGISGVALFGFLIGVSTHYLMMAVFLVFMGLMGGGYHPSASPLISSVVDEKVRGRALGIHQIGGTASFFIAPLIAVGIARKLGWRASLITISVPIIVYGIALFAILNRWGFGGATRTRGKIGAGEQSGAQGDQNAGRVRNIAPVIALNALVQIFVYTSVNFIPFFVVDHLGGTKETAAVMLSLAHSAGIWSGPLGGLLSDRIGKVPILVFTGLITGPLLLLLSRTAPGFSLAVVLIFMGLAMYMSMPVTESYVISHAPRGKRSTILGFYYFASRGGPGLLAPAMGFLIDRYSFRVVFILMGALMSAASIALSAVLAQNEYRARRA